MRQRRHEIISPLSRAMRQLSDHARGALLAATGIIIASPDALLVRLVQTSELTLAFWRGLLTALVLLAWLALRRGRELPSAFRALGRVGCLAAALYTAGIFLFVFALKRTAAANVLIIFGAEPLCAALLTALILKERVLLRTWLAAFAVVIGLGIVFSGGLSRGTLLGDLLAFGGVICVATRFVLFRAAREVDMVPSIVVGGVLAALVLLPFINPLDIEMRDMLLLLLMAAILLPVAQLMLVAAPRYLPAPEVALIVLLEAVLGPIWVWAVQGEIPSRETMIGGALIIGTLVVLSALALKRPSR